MPVDSRRRALLLGTAAAALLTALPRTPRAASLTAEEFLTLSQELTGKNDLDPALAAGYLAAFEELGQGAALMHLAAGGAEQALAQELVAAWYSGIVRIGQQQRLVTYEEALIWSAMDYTKPPGFCSGGGFGAWAKAPQL